MRIAAIIVALTGALCGVSTAQEFDHLAVDGDAVSTTHGLPLTVSLPDRLESLGETHFRESYGGPSFDVSAAAFASDSELVAIHAETHTDGSGGLDYSDLTPDTLAGIPLHSRVDCFDLREETPEDIEGNGFLRFLRERGFDFERAFVLKRFFLTDTEGASEVVLSYGRETPACPAGGVPAALAAEVGQGARAAFASLAPAARPGAATPPPAGSPRR